MTKDAESGALSFVPRDAESITEGALTIDATGVEVTDGFVTISAPFISRISTASDTSVNSVAFYSSGTLQIDSTIAEDGTAASTLYEGTVVVSDADDNSGALNVSGGENVQVNEGEVTVVASEGTVTSITGLDVDGENLNYDGKLYTYNEVSDYTLIVETIYAVDEDGNPTTEVSETRLYDTTEEGNTDVKTLSDYIPYIQVGDDGIITLDDTNERAFYGSEQFFSPSYFAALSSDGTAYTFTRNEEGTGIDPIAIETAIDNVVINTVGFNATIGTESGSATVNGKEFVAADTEGLVIASVYEDETNSGATLTLGTVQVQAGTTLETTSTMDDASGKTVAVNAGDTIIVKVGATDDDNNVTSEGIVTSITGMADGSEIDFDGVNYKVADGEIIAATTDEEEAVTAVNIYDLASNNDLVELSGAIAYYTIEGEIAITDDVVLPARYGVPELAAYSKSTYLFDAEAVLDDNEAVTGYTFTKNDSEEAEAVADGLTIDVTGGADAAVITTTGGLEADIIAGGGVTINGTTYEISEGDSITVAASDDTAALKEGIVVAGAGTLVIADGVNVEVSNSGDEDEINGAIVAVSDGTVTSISDLNDGETVSYNGRTYIGEGGQYIVNDAEGNTVMIVEEADSSSNLLDLEGVAYVQIESDNTIALTTTEPGVTFYGTDPTYSASTYFARLEVTAPEEDGGATAYNFVKRDDADDIDELIISAETISDAVAIATDFAADVMTAGTATVNGATFTAAENYSDGLTIAATYEDGTAGATLTDGTVIVDSEGDNFLNVTGAEDNITEVTGNVVVVVEAGAVSSITDLADGESLYFRGATYTGSGDQIIVATTTTDDEGNETTSYEIYEVTETENTDLLELTGAIPYIQIVDSTIDLTGEITAPAFYGEQDNYATDTYFAKLTLDAESGKYTFTQNVVEDVPVDVSNLVINTASDANIGAAFTAQVVSAGSVTVNDVAFNSADGALTIDVALNEDEEGNVTTDTTLYTGTVLVRNSIDVTNGESISEVTGGDDGAEISVTASDGNITAIAGIGVGESFVNNQGDSFNRTAIGLFGTSTEETGENVTMTAILSPQKLRLCSENPKTTRTASSALRLKTAKSRAIGMLFLPLTITVCSI